MKPQDIAFFIVVAGLLYAQKPKWFVWAGLASIIVSMPLFARWVFFTAERLTWYAAAFFLIALVMMVGKTKHHFIEV